MICYTCIEMQNKWTLLAFIAGIHVTYVVARSLPGVLAVPIQTETGLDNVSFGVLVAASFWTHAAFVPFTAWLGDRFNRVLLIACAALGWSVMTVLSGLSTGFWSLLTLASVAFIIPQSMFGPTACALLSDYHLESRTVALSCHQSAYYIGWFVSGAAVAGILSVCRDSWRAAFWVVGSVGVVVAALFFAFFRSMPTPVRGKNASQSDKPGFVESLKAFFGCPTARLLAVGYVANIFVIFGYSSWGPKFVAEKFASSAKSGTGVETGKGEPAS